MPMLKHSRAVRAVSRDDVAERAGVSSATVSRVYNDPSSVSEERRKRVLQCADELGYRPDKTASSLRRGSSGNILFLEVDHRHAPHWARLMEIFFGNALHGTLSVIEDSMYQLAIHTLSRSEDILLLPRNYRYNGIIFFDSISEDDGELLESLGVPYVLCHNTSHYRGFDKVYIKQYEASRHIASYLIGTGHRKPVYVGNRLFSDQTASLRLSGFRDAFTEAGIETLVLDEAPNHRNGELSVPEVAALVRGGKADCVGVVNDYAACLLVNGLLKEGIQIPEDVSVVGFDNVPISFALPFRLTTVDLNITELYRVATQALLDKTKMGARIDIGVEPDILIGDSVAPRS